MEGDEQHRDLLLDVLVAYPLMLTGEETTGLLAGGVPG